MTQSQELTDRFSRNEKGFILGQNSVIEKGVVIGDHTSIGHNTVIHEGTLIGSNVKIGSCNVLGQQPLRSPLSTRPVSRQSPLRVGEDTVIGSLVLVSAGTRIGKGCMIADHASIREGNLIDDFTIIGKGVTIEYSNRIGRHCKLMNSVHITGNTTIEDNVFFGAMVTTMNDKYMDIGSRELEGPTIRTGARIGSNSTILPSVKVGRYAVIGAGAVVTNDIPDHALALGVPARVVRKVESGYPVG